MADKCPECGNKLECLGGCSARPDNWYCEKCGWEAWTARQEAYKTTPKPNEDEVERNE